MYGRITHHTYETRYDLTKVYITLYTFCEGGSTEAGLLRKKKVSGIAASLGFDLDST